MKKLLYVMAFSVVGIPFLSAQAQSEADREAIKKSAQAFVNAFNFGNAKAIGVLFSESAEYTTTDGVVHKGRETIVTDFEKFFEQNKGLQIGLNIEQIRFLSPNMAIEEGRTWMLESPIGEPGYSRYRAVHSKIEGEWRVASIEEKAEIVPSHYVQLKEMEWLVGTWEADFGDSRLETTIEWTANKSFLKRTYSVMRGTEELSSGIQVIGWDPAREQIVSWTFSEGGGHGQGFISREGERSILETTSVLTNGAIAKATNILRKYTDNHFSWQSVNRTINGEEIADVPEVNILRVSSGAN